MAGGAAAQVCRDPPSSDELPQERRVEFLPELERGLAAAAATRAPAPDFGDDEELEEARRARPPPAPPPPPPPPDF